MQQPLCQGLVFALRQASMNCAFHRQAGKGIVFQGKKKFGGNGADGPLIGLQESGIRRRVGFGHGSKKRPGVLRIARVGKVSQEAVGEVDLISFAPGDTGAHMLDRLVVFIFTNGSRPGARQLFDGSGYGA
jgi:hypothetical protein